MKIYNAKGNGQLVQSLWKTDEQNWAYTWSSMHSRRSYTAEDSWVPAFITFYGFQGLPFTFTNTVEIMKGVYGFFR